METNLTCAKQGQIWKSPNGEYCVVKDVLDFNSSKLVIFEGLTETEEHFSFDFTDGWEKYSGSTLVSESPEPLLH